MKIIIKIIKIKIIKIKKIKIKKIDMIMKKNIHNINVFDNVDEC